jgi:hypothetical protein
LLWWPGWFSRGVNPGQRALRTPLPQGDWRGRGDAAERCHHQRKEKPLGLKLTKAGSAALGLAGEEEAAPQPKTRRKPKKHAPGEDQDAREPRAGSKQAQIIALMQRKAGASLAAMVDATGWLPHTTRAALTGLRQKGYAIERDKSPHGKTVYRLPARARG